MAIITDLHNKGVPAILLGVSGVAVGIFSLAHYKMLVAAESQPEVKEHRMERLSQIATVSGVTSAATFLLYLFSTSTFNTFVIDDTDQRIAIQHLCARYWGSWINGEDLVTLSRMMGVPVQILKQLYDKSQDLTEFVSKVYSLRT